MDSNITDIFLVVVLAIVVSGAFLTLIGHLLFLHRLRLTHPDLWRVYCEIAFTLDHTSYKHFQLFSRLYPGITDPSTLRARRADLLISRIFACSALASALAFAAWSIIPQLNLIQ